MRYIFNPVFIHEKMKFRMMKGIPLTKVLFFVLLLDLLSLSSGQNCAVPKIITVKEDHLLTETLDTGQHLASIKVWNVVGASIIEQKPANFSSVKYNPDLSEVTLQVKTPLWRNGSTEKSYIDETRSNFTEVVVQLTCEDGRTKDITVIIPIRDENTEKPRFENSTYSLETEACLEHRCALIFTKDIVVIDEDRDWENAEMGLEINCSIKHARVNLLSTAVNKLESWYGIDGHRQIKELGHQIKVKLEIQITDINIFDKDTNSNSVEFELYAWNKKALANGRRPIATTHVQIRFTEYLDRKFPPVFSSPVYYMPVVDNIRKRPIKLYPSDIHAFIPGNDDAAVDITFNVKSQSSFKFLNINSKTGFVYFKDNIDYQAYRRLSTCVTEHEIIATRVEKGIESAKVGYATLITYFPDCETELCENPGFASSTKFSVDLPNFATTEHEKDVPNPDQIITDHGNETGEVLPTTLHPPLPSPPTRPPEHCTCDCTQFSCKNSREPSVITGFSYHADPYYCTKYHQCSKRDDGDYDQSTLTCPTQTIFCPNMSECLTVEECLKRTGESMKSPNQETGRSSEVNLEAQGSDCGNWSCTCFGGMWPGDPSNLCNATNYMDLIEDPNHCDIFHQCQQMEEPHSHHYIDYPHRCPKGLIYCHEIRTCGHPSDARCSCNKTLKYCDVHEMGKWGNFNIFNKTFIPSFSVSSLFNLFGYH